MTERWKLFNIVDEKDWSIIKQQQFQSNKFQIEKIK